ncbi:hypothetical protein ACEQ8H_007795 [Pleosporales sp. CAS-2024a]
MSTPNTPTPLDEIKTLFSRFSHLRVLRHCLGIHPIAMPRTPDPDLARVRCTAAQLAQHTVLICIDIEHWTLNSDEMTELGLGVLHTQDVLALARGRNYGDHGFNLMARAGFHLLRLREKAHLASLNARSGGGGPKGNSFGQARFVTFAEARDLLRQLVVQRVTHDGVLRGCARPIVLLGHSVAHDREHLRGKDLGFDVDALGTVVKVIDTQCIVAETKCWFGARDPIGLDKLAEKLEFEHTNAHTAANDAARTLVAGVLLALPEQARRACQRTTQEVVHDLETVSVGNFVPLGGADRYCWLCGSVGHMGDANCPFSNRTLQCDECMSRGLVREAAFHVALHCPIVALEIAEERLAWYREQGSWRPKHRFDSRGRLQSFAPNAPVATPASSAEMAARRQWYDSQRQTGPLRFFTWYGRAFSSSPLRHAPPAGQKPHWNTRRGGYPAQNQRGGRSRDRRR